MNLIKDIIKNRYNSTQRENNTELKYFCKRICIKENPFKIIYT